MILYLLCNLITSSKTESAPGTSSKNKGASKRKREESSEPSISRKGKNKTSVKERRDSFILHIQV